MERLERLFAYMEKQADGVLITSQPNRSYFSGFTGSAGCLLISPGQRLLFTDSRYTEQAKNQAPDFTVIQTQELLETLPQFADKYQRIAFEAEALSYTQYEEYREALPGKLVPLKGISSLRQVKDEEEIQKIAKAAEITDSALAKLLPKLKVGVSELEAAAELEYQMRLLGAEGAAFPTIVASGPNSALPHAQPGSRRLGWGDFVVIDCGAKWQGYCADLTRIFVVGEPSAKQQEIYQLVLDAQLVGLEALQAGMGARELDATARSVIGAAGYADAFGHGLGHGVGLEVHEEPRLSPKGEGELAAGMVVTVEPGIYLAGWGGVRIEDLVLVKEDGREILSKTKKELVSVG